MNRKVSCQSNQLDFNKDDNLHKNEAQQFITSEKTLTKMVTDILQFYKPYQLYCKSLTKLIQKKKSVCLI